MKQKDFFKEIVSLENLFLAWGEFEKGKKWKKDVMEFSLNLSENVYNLHQDLKNKTYTHGPYHAFNISDPKPRNIHKAIVRDRLLHHAIYRVLYPHFNKKFIYDSYSCRLGKGTHKAMNRFKDFGRKVSKNNTKQCWVLKCDIRKFFASINQEVLLCILKSHNLDSDTLWLLNQVISSFNTTNPNFISCDISHDMKGLPLGNLTSQLLVNIYMNEFDGYIKHELHQKYYIRYADDFVIFSHNKKQLIYILRYIVRYLEYKLKLTVHPSKISIKTLSSGVDFLGFVHFPYHRVLRTSTKRRMKKKLQDNSSKETVQSYLGLLNHGNTWKLKEKYLI